jgi:hypothetical protein
MDYRRRWPPNPAMRRAKYVGWDKEYYSEGDKILI